MATPGTVKVNDTGTKNVDVSELTRSDGTVVERQRAIIGDDENPLALATVRSGRLYVSPPNRDAFLERIGVKRRRARIFGTRSVL